MESACNQIRTTCTIKPEYFEDIQETEDAIVVSFMIEMPSDIDPHVLLGYVNYLINIKKFTTPGWVISSFTLGKSKYHFIYYNYKHFINVTLDFHLVLFLLPRHIICFL